MSRTTITRAAAKAEARAIQAESKATANPLTYTQALAEVAKRHGFANLHEMTVAYDAPASTQPPKFFPTPAGWLMAIDPNRTGPSTARELAEYFAATGESPQFPKDSWRQAVRREETTHGYWDWVAERHVATKIQPNRGKEGPFKVGGYETGRYGGGLRVYDDRRGFHEGKVRDFDIFYPGEPEAYAAKLNAIHLAGGKGAILIDYAIENGLALEVLDPKRLEERGIKGLPYRGLAEMMGETHGGLMGPDDAEIGTHRRLALQRATERAREDEAEDGTSGQDRDSYSDEQDRDSHTVDPNWDDSAD